MMRNRFRTILFLLTIILFIVSLSFIYDTLALFETDTSGVVNNDIGKWIIKINNKDITDGTSETIVIDNFNYTPNEHIEAGYIAPGSSAYFDLVIDATESDVAVKYILNLDLNSTTYANNIRFVIDGLDTIGIIKTSENDYTGVITLEDIKKGKTLSLRIYVYWDNLEEYDEEDSKIGTELGNSLKFPIKFHATQYLGEEITPYE